MALSGLPKNEAFLLGLLLYPYRVELSEEEDRSDLIICSGACSESKPQIRIPSQLSGRDRDPGPDSHGNGVVEFPYNLVRSCAARLEAAENPPVGLGYVLSTRLPFRYNRLPASTRNRLLRTRMADSDLSRHLVMEAARKILVEAFAQLGFHLVRKNPPSLLVTHDIESERGLRGASALKDVEDDLAVRSTWFVVSHEYPIEPSVAARLADNSVIGSHDVKHDGRLGGIRTHSKLVERMRKSRQKLEEVFGQEVICFRAPLLQFSSDIMSALKEAGYRSDFSLPCWEPIYPPTMSGFGIECAQAFEMEGVVETPLTLFQDHQVLALMGMNVNQAVNLWVEQARLIRHFEGDIVLLVHPDYSFSRDLGEYRRLLTELLNIHNSRTDYCDVSP